MKKFKRLAQQSLVFIGIYAIAILILTISRMQQTAFSFDKLISNSFTFTPFVYVAAGVITLLIIGLFYKRK